MGGAHPIGTSEWARLKRKKMDGKWQGKRERGVGRGRLVNRGREGTGKNRKLEGMVIFKTQ